MPHGVPQGSIIGPRLFTLFVNDLPKVIENYNQCNNHKFDLQIYADDVQLYTSCCPSEVSVCIDRINECLSSINDWAMCNGLCLNPNKTKCLIISRNKCNITLSNTIKLQNKSLEIVDKAKNLAIIFNSRLQWTDHINSKIGTVFGMLRILYRTQSLTPFNIRLLLAKTYLLPTLLYGCELFASLESEYKRKMQRVFNAIARYVYKRRKFDHISDYSKLLFGMTMEKLLDLRTLIMLHKVIRTKEPPYLLSRIEFSRSERTCNIKQFKHNGCY